MPQLPVQPSKRPPCAEVRAAATRHLCFPPGWCQPWHHLPFATGAAWATSVARRAQTSRNHARALGLPWSPRDAPASGFPGGPAAPHAAGARQVLPDPYHPSSSSLTSGLSPAPLGPFPRQDQGPSTTLQPAAAPACLSRSSLPPQLLRRCQGGVSWRRLLPRPRLVLVWVFFIPKLCI